MISKNNFLMSMNNKLVNVMKDKISLRIKTKIRKCLDPI